MIATSIQLQVDRITYPKRADISAAPATQILSRNTMRGISMKQIKLTQGKVAIVDDEDFEELSKYKWWARKSRGAWYAMRATYLDGQHTLLMHRAIMNAQKGQMLDHKNGNGLDNRHSNLRFCTHSQNQHNQRRRRNGTSRYKGVHWHAHTQKWFSQIRLNNTSYYIGVYKSEIDAAKAYDAKAKELFGRFACTNF